jgi:protein-disulfide isomerase
MGSGGLTDLRSAPLPPVDAADRVRGPREGALVIVYADFECPYCAVVHERLRHLPVRTAFRHFPMRSKHPRALACAAAAEAAAAQGAFWAMHDSLFADQGRLDDPHLWRRAEALGLEVGRFDRDRRAAEALERVTREFRGGLRGGVATTPTLVVDGELHSGLPDPALLERLGARSDGGRTGAMGRGRGAAG